MLNPKEQVQLLMAWVITHRLQRRGDEGFSAVEWTVLVLGVIAIASGVVLAVKHYTDSQVGKLGDTP